jgi:hypothetical protein
VNRNPWFSQSDAYDDQEGEERVVDLDSQLAHLQWRRDEDFQDEEDDDQAFDSSSKDKNTMNSTPRCDWWSPQGREFDANPDVDSLCRGPIAMGGIDVGGRRRQPLPGCTAVKPAHLDGRWSSRHEGRGTIPGVIWQSEAGVTALGRDESRFMRQEARSQTS